MLEEAFIQNLGLAEFQSFFKEEEAKLVVNQIDLIKSDFKTSNCFNKPSHDLDLRLYLLCSLIDCDAVCRTAPATQGFQEISKFYNGPYLIG